jgi:hypothetical protein
MKRILAFAFLAVSLVAFGLACDSASPVAPTGTLLSISASPNEIGTSGTSAIRVTALRSNGTPVNPGTIIRLSTTLGTIDEQVETDDQGVARAELRGDGRIGTATVTARSGSAEMATVDVMIGKVATGVSLQASPSQVDESGGTIELLAVVRDDDGEPLSGATVNFQTEVGTLVDSGGGIIRSDSNGEARETLSIEAVDLAPITANSFTVGVMVGAGSSTVSDSSTIRINRCAPTVQITAENLGNNMVRVTNDTTGEEPIDWAWDFDNNGTVDSVVKNPADYEYNGPGRYTVVLRATNVCGSDEGSTEVQVTSGSL